MRTDAINRYAIEDDIRGLAGSAAQNFLSNLWLEAQLAAVSGQSTIAGATRYDSRAGKVLSTSPMTTASRSTQMESSADPSDCARAQKSRAGGRQGCGLTTPLRSGEH
jgi:hypothetical protein